MNIRDIAETMLVFGMMVRDNEAGEKLTEFVEDNMMAFDFAMAVFVDDLTIPANGLVDITIRNTFDVLCRIVDVDQSTVENAQDFIDKVIANG